MTPTAPPHGHSVLVTGGGVALIALRNLTLVSEPQVTGLTDHIFSLVTVLTTAEHAG